MLSDEVKADLKEFYQKNKNSNCIYEKLKRIEKLTLY